MIRPPPLRPGARVAVVAPAGPVPREPFLAGSAILGARYQLVYDERLFTRTGFLAGSDAERLAELEAALFDPRLEALFVARGGYGLMRLLPALDARRFAAAPKWIVGFSDVTALHAWALGAGVMALHAPVVTQLGSLGRGDHEALFACLEWAPPPPLVGLEARVAGAAAGRLMGGNLEIVTRLLGTAFALDLDGAVLLLEEVGEVPYRIDRQLTQLRLAGALAGVRAVVLGDFERCGPVPEQPSALAVAEERLTGLGVPIYRGAAIGHGARNQAVVLGAAVELAADRLRFK